MRIQTTRDVCEDAISKSLRWQKEVSILWSVSRTEYLSDRCTDFDAKADGDIYYGAEPQGGAQGDLTWAVKLVGPRD